jgi:hypothetical protein
VLVIVGTTHVVSAAEAEQLTLALLQPGGADGTIEHRLLFVAMSGRLLRFLFLHRHSE